MRERIFVVFVGAMLSFSTIWAAPKSMIVYSVTDLNDGQWQYVYDVRNVSLTETIEEFIIWFDYGLYDNLVVTTQDPTASNWNETVWQAEPVLEDSGAYNALANESSLAIEIGEHAYGFSVCFNWLGTDVPGSQFYEIVVPGTSPVQTIDSGYTVPEPAAVVLMGIGVPFLLRRRQNA